MKKKILLTTFMTLATFSTYTSDAFPIEVLSGREVIESSCNAVKPVSDAVAFALHQTASDIRHFLTTGSLPTTPTKTIPLPFIGGSFLAAILFLKLYDVLQNKMTSESSDK